MDKLHGNTFFFQSVPGSKNYAQISSKQGRGSNNKKSENLKKKLNLFLIGYIFPTCKALIHSIWIFYEKIMDNLAFQAIRASS